MCSRLSQIHWRTPAVIETYSQDIETLARQAAGNHRKFDCFIWWEHPDEDHNWCIVYTHNRDSDVLDQSNAAAIAKEMQPFCDDGTARIESHNHWACGHVDGYAILVYDVAGEITEAFKTWVGIQQRLEDYPILDDSDLTQREHDEAIEIIECCLPSAAICDLPDDWPELVLDWCWENDIWEGSIWSQDVDRAFAALGWLEDD